MSSENPRRRNGAIVSLKQFVRSPARAPAAEVEICDLCSVRLAPQHRHLLEMEKRGVLCACDSCALRFQDVVGGRYRLIPRDARPLPDFQMTEAQWESLSLPINLAFFFHSTAAGKIVALYPGPAGATESLLPLSSWNELVAANPALAEMGRDVEALLVNRVGAERRHYIAPIDICYELVGLIRLHWRGLSGGEAVWTELGAFFARLDAAADPAPESREAACG